MFQVVRSFNPRDTLGRAGPYLLASPPRAYLCRVRVAQRRRRNRRRPSQPRTQLWMMTPATCSRSARSFSSTATWPARKNTLVLPKQYCSGSGMSSERAHWQSARISPGLREPRNRTRYRLKNSSYVHLETQGKRLFYFYFCKTLFLEPTACIM